MSSKVNIDPRPRGRPRSAKAREAILNAAAGLIEDGGIGAVTMEATARRAGVGKPTIYRYWANREELAMAALLAHTDMTATVKTSSSIRADFVTHLSKLVAVFSSPRGHQAALLVASSDADSELGKAFRNQVLMQSRAVSRDLLLRARRLGESHAVADVELVLDLVHGTIFYRLLMGHAALDQRLVEDLVDVALGEGGPA